MTQELLHEELLNLFGSLAKTIEMLALIDGAKPVVRTILPSSQIKPCYDFCQAHGIFMDVSDFKIVSIVDEDKGFSNKGFRVHRSSAMPGEYVFYLSKDKELAQQAKSAEFFDHHYELGRLLGYPECCCNFFEEHAPVQSEDNNDYVLPALQNSRGKKFSFLLNVVGRYEDVALLSHFPCSFHCKESMKIAQQHLLILHKYSPSYAQFVENKLKGCFVYSEEFGVHELHDAAVDDASVQYEHVTSTADTLLHYDLHSSNLIIGKNIYRGNELVRAYDDLYVMQFV